MHPSAFDTLFTKSVPHLLEKIFFSLDYQSFKGCLDVSKPWNYLLKSERFKKLGNDVFREDIERDLWQASNGGNCYEIKRIFACFEVDVNFLWGNEQDTPLHRASMNGDKDVVQLLLDQGADPNKADEEGETPLHWATKKGHKDVVQLLLDQGAVHNIASHYGRTPLHQAVSAGYQEVVQLLLDVGADPSTIDQEFIRVALDNDYTDIVQMLKDAMTFSAK